MAYLEWTLDLDQPQGDSKATLRDVHEKVLSQPEGKPAWALAEAEKALTPPSLEAIESESELLGFGDGGVLWIGHMMTCYMQLSHQRISTESIQPIQYTEVKAYSELTDTQFHPLEIDVLMSMDRLVVSTSRRIMNEQINKSRK